MPAEEQTCTKPASRGHLPCLRRALSQGFRLNSNAAAAAARGGHLDCLKLLLLEGCTVSVAALLEAALHGHLTCLQLLCLHTDYLFRKREDVCTITCHGGSLPCLQYLRRHGYCLSGLCQVAAASAGQLSCMQYLVSENCPWDVQVMWSAAKSGNFLCLCFAYENGCPWCPQDGEYGRVTISRATISAPQCLLFVEKYCPVPISSVLSSSTYTLLQSTQMRRAVALWCLTKCSLPCELHQVILQHADLLCTALCARRDRSAYALPV